MNAKGRKVLTDSLTEAIDNWLHSLDPDPNESGATDIGYISELTTHFMAIAAINVLESNSDAQRFAVREKFLLMVDL